MCNFFHQSVCISCADNYHKGIKIAKINNGERSGRKFGSAFRSSFRRGDGTSVMNAQIDSCREATSPQKNQSADAFPENFTNCKFNPNALNCQISAQPHSLAPCSHHSTRITHNNLSSAWSIVLFWP